MVIGRNVQCVQRVSSYCLKKNLEVFPYYGIPMIEDISLFAPHVLVLCLPIAEEFQRQIDRPYILWSEEIMDEELSMVSTPTQLYVSIEKVLQVLN